ncbi:uncharacterized protein LOC129576476 isoform X3 [Sitodiplosis mosellana]|nr:uncharacterized protein LOC129576476 isoform X3 [Sitodiplosis mosellana]XP_055317642.1 uncharacterized protein LOC129576476 isoform X3 [Sitodiplosis mosellana]
MDRIVWFIVLTVVANFILEFSGVWAQTKDSQSYGPPAASYHLPQQRISNNVRPDDVELVDPMQTSPSENNGRAARNKLFDNIFKIPISTLNAVNDLLQGIGGTFGASG